MLQNAYLVAKIGADTAENEQHFAEILPIGRRVADRCVRGLTAGRLAPTPPELPTPPQLPTPPRFATPPEKVRRWMEWGG